MSDAEAAALLDKLVALAERAGAEILKYYRGDYQVRTKSDESPVTDADEAAEALILAALRELTPDIPIVAEEEMARGIEPVIGGNRFWLVDALDGTREFIANRDEFTVNIGLIEDTSPVIGVVHAPALDVTYAATGPGTATRRQGTGKPQPIGARAIPAAGAVAVASRAHGDKDKMQAMLKQDRIADVRVSGSSIKFCLLAAGEADIYPRYGHTREWDTAAAHAVLAAAGGSVRTLDGAEMAYRKADFLNPEFIARGRDG